MRNILMFIILLLVGFKLIAQDDEIDYNQRMKQISAELKLTSNEIKRLGTQQKKLFMEMHHQRVKLLKEDPELRELHRRIMALHKELALKLDKNKDMATLKNKAEKIEIQIEGLLRKKKTLKMRKTNINNELNPKKEKE